LAQLNRWRIEVASKQRRTLDDFQADLRAQGKQPPLAETQGRLPVPPAAAKLDAAAVPPTAPRVASDRARRLAAIHNQALPAAAQPKPQTPPVAAPAAATSAAQPAKGNGAAATASAALLADGSIPANLRRPPMTDAQKQEHEAMVTRMNASTARTSRAIPRGAPSAATTARSAASTAAKASSRKPVTARKTSGERHRYDWAAAEEKAGKGTLPGPLDFSAETHARFRPLLAEVRKAALAGDIEALRKIKINPISSSPKAVKRYRDLCVKALGAAKKK
jgi:hypothetical protein